MKICKQILHGVSIAALLTAIAATAAPEDKKKEAPAKEKKELNVSADSVEMDFGKRIGYFTGNVKVSDPKSLLTADKMRIFLTEKNEMKSIEAEGNVMIQEVGTTRKATAGKAVFNVLEDTIVLSDKPALIDKNEWTMKKAEKFIYNRKTSTFKSIGRTTLTFLVEEKKGGGGMSDFLSPERPKDKKKDATDE